MGKGYIITVIGLGKLGLPTALSFAKAGFKVWGVEIDKTRLTKLKEGISPIYEPGVQEYLNKYGSTLTLTDKIQEAIMNSDVAFVIVPTPSEEDGTFSLKFVIPVIEKIGEALREKSEFFVVTIVSTITPLSIDKKIKPLLEKVSGKKCGFDFGLCYNPEFVALGSVLANFENPDFVLIGESDKKSGDRVEFIHKQVCKNSPKVMRMNFVNAEITKLALNTYVTTKISYANMLARICEKIEGADVDVVTEALGLDKRIGGRYLKGGLGYGGPCFPRDNRALSSFAKKINLDIVLPDIIDIFNKNQPHYIVSIIERYLTNRNDLVGIIGITYKSNTDVTEESQGLKIMDVLKSVGIGVVVFDTIPKQNLRADIKFIDDFQEFVKQCKILILTVASDEFKKLIVENMDILRTQEKIIIDCWRFLKNVEFPANVKYIKLGVGYI
ncbi:MAG: nucleotide sugar dehydrogenase [Planctomycetota bacterium]